MIKEELAVPGRHLTHVPPFPSTAVMPAAISSLNTLQS